MTTDKTIQQGVIKFFSYKRGYGFIIPQDSQVQEDVFFHFSAISNDPGIIVHLIPNEKVEFELLKGPRGFLANNVTSKNVINSMGKPLPSVPSERGHKVGSIYHHYYYSLKKIMDNLVKDQIESTEKRK